MEFLILYLAAINLAAFVMCFWDKKKAEKGKWRVSEKTLFILALFGGSLGLYVSMRMFHHKTRHKRFMIGVPLIFLLQIIIIVYLLFVPGGNLSVIP